jgi:hypothetical protein
MGVDPSIIPYIYVISLANPPEAALFEDPPSFENTLPGIAGSWTNLSLHEGVFRKIFGFQNSSHKRGRFSEDSPSLFGQHSFIESSCVSKAHTTFNFPFTSLFPIDPVGSFVVSAASPPKFTS